MTRLLVRQLLSLAGVLLVASFVIYAGMYVAPGSAESVLFGGHAVDPAVRAAIRAKYHLDDPFLVQYWHWLANVLHGDFGTSLAYHQPVSDRISATAVTTLLLVTYAAVLIVVFGVLFGVIAALRPGKVDSSLMALTNVGVAVPTFVAAILLISVFSVDLGWFPVYGSGEGFLDRLHHLTLPAVALAFWAVALLARVTRSSMRDELRTEHVETARARGLSSGTVVRRHVFRNALVPIVTVAGLEVAGLISGTVVVEQAFGLNGLGQLLITSVSQKDLPTVQAVCLILVAAFVTVNALVDIVYTLLDPRLRLSGASS